MAYTRGTNSNIIVGAAALFVSNFGQMISTDGSTVGTTAIPSAVVGESYKDSLTNRYSTVVRNIGYTNNGIEITFTPTFGDVNVDQLLDVAKLYKSGMTVTLKTTLAEATLENLLVAIAQKNGSATLSGTGTAAVIVNTTGTATWTESLNATGATVTATTGINTGAYVDILSGDLGDYPVERSIVAVGPSVAITPFTGASGGIADQKERIYVAYRAVSIQNVTIAAKRDAATAFDVEFRLLPDNLGSYGKIVDRSY